MLAHHTSVRHVPQVYAYMEILGTYVYSTLSTTLARASFSCRKVGRQQQGIALQTSASSNGGLLEMSLHPFDPAELVVVGLL